MGGITVGRENEIKPYLDYVIKEHKKRNPEVNVVDSYVGLKKELMVKRPKEIIFTTLINTAITFGRSF